MSKEFEDNKIYIAKCKKSTEWGDSEDVEKDQWYRCIRKKSLRTGNIIWHTNQENDNFDFDWSWEGWYRHFNKPIEVMTYKDFAVGEEYLCIEDFYMCVSGEIVFKKGNKYKVKRIECQDVVFIDEDNITHALSGDYLSIFVKEDKEQNFEVGDEVEIITSREFHNHSPFKVGDKFIIKEISKQYYGTWLRYEKGRGTGVFSELCKITKKAKDIEKESSWKFRDDHINWNQVCFDMLEDNKCCFLITSKDKAYVGLLHSGKKIGVPIVIDDFIGDKNFLSSFLDYPYGIFEIPLNKIDIWREKLKKYSENYNKFQKSLNNYIKDRDRSKSNPITHKVYAF